MKDAFTEPTSLAPWLAPSAQPRPPVVGFPDQMA